MELKTFCATKVPAYMSPDRFVFRDRLPRTSSDKIDYQALLAELRAEGGSVGRSHERTLDYAERWLRDGLHVLRPPFSALQITADMTHATRRLEELRREGVHATATHLLVQAAARALAANPRLHQLIAGTRRHRPRRWTSAFR